ncbi:hypothetical protein NLG97_g5989 [Lecanicillium saksenae]|uniref:Uncharacterized protein n=1 Tax=Lecanicillium saksenae TaxID=468837 RepID=A0ACC1QTH5_9HYPO|nr:hypothetical protein NLG97_g5989 [Lecanicillium saksenae]
MFGMMELFGSLPYEIRAMIWSLAVQPRMVPVHLRSRLGERCLRNNKSSRSGYFVSPAVVPGVLHACHESRDLAIRTRQYEKLTPFRCRQEPYVWVNFDLDIVDIGQLALVYFEDAAEQIRRIRLTVEIDSPWWRHDQRYYLHSFYNLVQDFVDAADGWDCWSRAFDETMSACLPENSYVIDAKSRRMMNAADLMQLPDAGRDRAEHAEKRSVPAPTDSELLEMAIPQAQRRDRRCANGCRCWPSWLLDPTFDIAHFYHNVFDYDDW